MSDTPKFSLPLIDLYKLAKALEKAIFAKVYTKKESSELFPIMNKVITHTESIMRQRELNALYNEDHHHHHDHEQKHKKKKVLAELELYSNSSK